MEVSRDTRVVLLFRAMSEQYPSTGKLVSLGHKMSEWGTFPVNVFNSSDEFLEDPRNNRILFGRVTDIYIKGVNPVSNVEVNFISGEKHYDFKSDDLCVIELYIADYNYIESILVDDVAKYEHIDWDSKFVKKASDISDESYELLLGISELQHYSILQLDDEYVKIYEDFYKSLGMEPPYREFVDAIVNTDTSKDKTSSVDEINKAKYSDDEPIIEKEDEILIGWYGEEYLDKTSEITTYLLNNPYFFNGCHKNNIILVNTQCIFESNNGEKEVFLRPYAREAIILLVYLGSTIIIETNPDESTPEIIKLLRDAAIPFHEINSNSEFYRFGDTHKAGVSHLGDRIMYDVIVTHRTSGGFTGWNTLMMNIYSHIGGVEAIYSMIGLYTPDEMYMAICDFFGYNRSDYKIFNYYEKHIIALQQIKNLERELSKKSFNQTIYRLP